MNSTEKAIQAKRITEFNALEGAAKEIGENLLIIQSTHDDKPSRYTMNTSRIKRVVQVKISFDDGSDTLTFNEAVVHGYEIANALRNIMEERQKLIWKRMEQI